MKILITGASGGIGLEIAKIYYKKGAELYLVSRNTDKIQKMFPKSKCYSLDLSDEKSCIKLFKNVGNVDILINNAGYGEWGTFWQTKNDINMIKLNVVAVHILTKIYVRSMIKQNKGVIMNIASLAAYSYGPLMSTYYATKAYVQRLSASVDYELEKRGKNVRVLCVCPGPVNTNFNNRAGVSFSVKALSSKYTAKCIVNAIHKGKRITVPGVNGKILAFASRFAPEKLLLEIGYRVQKSKKDRN